MVDLKLENDEGIVKQANDVEMYKANDVYEEIYEMYLTNKNLICYYEKSNGLFAKSEEVTEKFPLESIRIVNDKLQIFKVDDDENGLGLQILFKNGERVHFVFEKKKELEIWYNAILETITGKKIEVDTPNNKTIKNENTVVGSLLGAFQTVKNIAKDQIEEVKGKIDDVKGSFIENEENDTISDNIGEEEQKEVENNKLINNKEQEDVKKANGIKEDNAIYCRNCGAKLMPNSKFCNHCGTSLENIENEVKDIEQKVVKEKNVEEKADVENTKNEIKEEIITKRENVYDGKIHKCPNCGEVLDSFVAKCPSCGFELSRQEIAESLKDFINKINKCDEEIASNNHTKTGWSSWSSSKKIMWIILNIFFVCIPLVIYFVLPLVLINKTPKLSKEERQMANLIENFPFPNDRESILAALVFAKEKVNFLSNANINRKSAYWLRLWSTKAVQLKQKADMLFPNDPIVKKSYDDLVNGEKKADKILKTKLFIGIIFLIFLYNSTNTSTDKKDYNATFEWQTNGIFAKLPEPETDNGKITIEMEKQLQIELYNISYNQFEEYVKECKDNGFTYDVKKFNNSFNAKDKDNYSLNINYKDESQVMTIYLVCYDI